MIRNIFSELTSHISQDTSDPKVRVKIALLFALSFVYIKQYEEKGNVSLYQ
jgi:hypothetical protein